MKLIHEWKIRNFAYLYYKDNYPKLQFIQSNTFRANGNKNNNKQQFFLRLYPKEFIKHCQKWVSLSVHMQKGEDVLVSCKIKIFDCENVPWEKREQNLNLNTENEIIFREFIERRDICDPTNGYLPEDCLTIHCEITIDGQGRTSSSGKTVSESNTKWEIDRLPDSWLISNFRNLVQQEKFFSSDELDFPNELDRIFLKLWPNNPKHNQENHISLLLYLIQQKRRSFVQYRMALIDSNNNEKYAKANRQQLNDSSEYGYKKYVELNQLLAEAELFPGNNLTVDFLVDLIGKELKDDKSIKPKKVRSINKAVNLDKRPQNIVINKILNSVIVNHSDVRTRDLKLNSFTRNLRN